MKEIILAGGSGTRLYPVAKVISKQIPTWQDSIDKYLEAMNKYENK